MIDKLSSIIKTKNYVCTVIGTGLLLLSMSLGIYDIALEQKAINITGKIISVDQKGTTSYATVEYKVSSIKYQQAVPIKDTQSAVVGEEMSVKYDKDDPSKPVNNNHLITIIPTSIISIVFLAFGLKGTIKEIKLNIKVNKLKTKGMYINCPISEVYLNNLVKPFRGKYPYRLRCKFINPKNNQEYVFESDNTYLNLHEVLNKYNNKSVLVYIDKDDKTNYYVDLSTLFPQFKLTSPEELMNPKPEEAKEENKESKEEITDEKNESNSKPEEEKKN